MRIRGGGLESGIAGGFGDSGIEDRRRRLGMAWGLNGFWFEEGESRMEDWDMGCTDCAFEDLEPGMEDWDMVDGL